MSVASREPRPLTRREGAKFCSTLCRDARASDRAMRITYPYWRLRNPDGTVTDPIGHDEACARLRLCPYCEAKLP